MSTITAARHAGEDLLPELFQPLKIGPMTVSNRMAMSGMSAGIKVDGNGEIDPQMVAYLVERARGEPGMMTIGASRVVPQKQSDSHGIQLYSDHIVPSLARMVDAVHQHDTRLGIQLWHGGGTEGTNLEGLMSPSGLSSNVRNAMGDATSRQVSVANRAMTLEDIHETVQHYASAARRCADAGFDFVEIHGAHGYLISNFMTPLFNRRTDEYGGSFENRTRFLLEIVAAVREAVGQRIAVGLKYNGSDFLGDKGWTIEESCRLAPLAAAAGADFITITAGLVGTPQLTIPPMYEPQGCYTDLAAAVRPHSPVPIATLGRIKTAQMARDVIAEGKADIVCFGRATIADSQFFAKVRVGDLAEIRPCLADCRGCIDEHTMRHKGGADASCVVNPRVGRELSCVDIEGSAKDRAKKVVVVGGGLAGMEAARMSAFLGHEVTLFERRAQLGGQMLLARQMPGRQEIGDIVPWYERQLAKLGVNVRLGTEVSEALLQESKADIVFIASGSLPAIPQNLIEMVLGAENTEIVLLDDLVEEKLPIGETALVVGGDQNGMVIADYLAQAGAKVTVAEPGHHFGYKLAAHDRWYLLNRQNAKHVTRIKDVHEIVLKDGDAIELETPAGPVDLPKVDTIVFASERKSERSLVEAAEAMGARVIVVGDANDVTSENAGTIFANVAHAYDNARLI